MHGEVQCGEVVQMIANLIKRLAIQLAAHDSSLVCSSAKLFANTTNVRVHLAILTVIGQTFGFADQSASG
jgi:hypothetical protein